MVSKFRRFLARVEFCFLARAAAFCSLERGGWSTSVGWVACQGDREREATHKVTFAYWHFLLGSRAQFEQAGATASHLIFLKDVETSEYASSRVDASAEKAHLARQWAHARETRRGFSSSCEGWDSSLVLRLLASLGLRRRSGDAVGWVVGAGEVTGVVDIVKGAGAWVSS